MVDGVGPDGKVGMEVGTGLGKEVGTDGLVLAHAIMDKSKRLIPINRLLFFIGASVECHIVPSTGV